jgi:hypothetical protein
MPVHIGSVTAKVTVFDGEFPLTDRQLRQITDHVLAAIASQQRVACLHREATEIHSTSQQSSTPIKDAR